jgi:ring-1,2-phenylacetyl-CoA epoxidase subunit PaaD
VSGADLTAVRAALQEVVDPEIPVLTIEDLGVLRDVTVGDDGRLEVTITPTYSGCPAMDTIRADVERVLAAEGFTDARVRTVLAPAWTTDWLTEEGRRKLAEAGIAPPRPAAATPPLGPEPVPVALVRCPRCGSADTRLVSRFGSTACKALRACNRCLEPFDHFKAI